LPPATLAQVLRSLDSVFEHDRFPDLLVGLNAADDAAVYRLNDEQAIIQTTDFFTPIVDTPYEFGAIAAANAMSDIYAMGGQVLLALNIAAFPPDLDPAILSEIIRGGADMVRSAGAVVAGGHTIQDKEPKYGMAVTGLVHPQRIMTKGGAAVGDRLVLTKPLGTGAITTALKRGIVDPADLESAVAWMMRLNRTASEIASRLGVRGATDITGFSLLGHASEMAEGSGLRFVIRNEALPWLPGARRYAADWVFPGGAHNNQAHFASKCRMVAKLSDWEQTLLFDPQTSGGLLLAVPEARFDDFASACKEQQQDFWMIGEVAAGEGIDVV
jgi:selenide, water dikinase